MTSQSGETAGKARSGIGDSVVGKAKEVASAVTGNDSLSAEGQLQQSRGKPATAVTAWWGVPL